MTAYADWRFVSSEVRDGLLRINEVRPPPTLVPRHLPRLDAEALSRGITHAALRAGVEVERPTPEQPRVV